jgi:outer membrane protein assembly factor BamB
LPGIREVHGQQDNPVYVDDSPQAWELFRRAADQTRDNAAEAVRLYQELLDDFALKLIPVREKDPDQFMCVRLRVLAALQRDDTLLQRYRLIQTAEAQRLLAADRLEDLAMTRSLTEPGLDALLRLAQRDLESARFNLAMSWLEQAMSHPDLSPSAASNGGGSGSRRAAHAWYMTALAAHRLDEPARVDAARDALVELGSEGAAFVQQLDAQLADAHAPPINIGVTPLDHGQASDLSDMVAQTIWTVPLDDALLARRFASAAPQDEQTIANLQQRSRLADLNTVIPTVAGQTVYVNEGHTVMALNRLTGRPVWSYADLNRIDLVESEEDGPMDMNVVSVEGDALVTLTGHAGSTSRSNQGRVICLDVNTGRLRWAAALSGLGGDDTEALFPHGVPIIAEGLVFVAARRVSPQLLTSAYVVALDLADGRVRWVQYLTSSGGLRQAPRPYCTLVHDAGSLYISSAVGAAARLDAGTGQVHWLRRTNVPLSQSMLEQGRRPWELAAPVVTPRGVMAVQPDQRRVTLIDRETGDQIESYPVTSPGGESWNSPRYLLADDHRVYAIGTDIRAFTLEQLDSPLWRLPAPATQEADAEPLGPDIKEARDLAEPLELRGRVQLVEAVGDGEAAATSGVLIVPAADGIQLVDAETGRVTHKLSVDAIGNPLAIDSQLIIACGNKLDSYMAFNRAERMLRERMSQAPDDPEPALSLLRLGVRVRNFALTMEAAELAARSINRLAVTPTPSPAVRANEARQELFSLLLDLAASGMLTTDTEGEQVFAALGEVAVDPTQRVEYLLAYGDWLADRSTLRAAEAYQSILSDPTLATTRRVVGGTARDAATFAAEHLRQLIQVQGESTYAPQADFAQLRLTQLQSASPVSVTGLLSLSREFPFAPAAAEAAIIAARAHAQQGHMRQALAALSRVWRTAPQSTGAGRLLGMYVQLCRDAGWNDHAAIALRSILQVRGDVELVSDAGSGSASQWLNEVTAATASRLPRVAAPPSPAAEPLTAKAIQGAALPWMTPPLRTPVDRALLRQDHEVNLLATDSLEPIWSSTVEADAGAVLLADDQRLLLWTSQRGGNDEPRAVMLSAADGTVQWTAQPLGAIVANPAVAELARIRSPGAQDRMPDGDVFDPRQTMALANSRALIMIQRTGAIAAVDLADGSTVLWQNQQAMEQVHLAMLVDDALILTGLSRPVDATSGAKTADTAAAIVILDPLTGQPAFEGGAMVRPHARGGVRWFTIAPMGRMVYGTADGIEAVDLFTGERPWTTTDFAAVQTQRGWSDGDRLVIEDQRGRLRSVNPADGTVSVAFDQPGRSDWEALDLRNLMFVGDRVVAHYKQRVVVYDMNGVVVGADVITDERDYQWLLPADQCLVLVSRRTLQVLQPDQSGRRTQHVYRVYALSHNGRALSDALELNPLPDRVQNVQLIDNWLLMSLQDTTLAIPMPAE